MTDIPVNHLMRFRSGNIPRVLLIGPSLKGGGAERHFSLLSQGLFGGTADICVFTGNQDGMAGTRYGTFTCLGWSGAYSYMPMARKVQKILSTRTYDIVFSFGRYPNLLAVLAGLGIGAGPKLVLSEITRPWKEILIGDPGLKSSLVKMLMKRTYPRADLFLANSIDGIEESVRHFRVERSKAVRVPNVVDSRLLAERAREDISFQWPDSGFVIATSSRLDRFKRVDILIKGVARLPASLRVAVVVIGDGPERENLQRLARDLRLDCRVFFTGWVENPLPFIRRSDLFVLCSEYEGFSNSVLEAMFLGIPVITSYCSSDAVEMCRQGAAMGFHVGNERELAIAIRNMHETSETRTAIVNNAMAYCAPHETKNAIPFYENILMNLFNW